MGTKSYVFIFNAKWNQLARALNNRIAAYFAAMYTVGNMNDDELKIEPGLSNTQEVVRCWRDIIQKLHPQFVDEASALKVSLFSNLVIEQEMSDALRKKRHMHQEGVFRRLYSAAMTKLEQIDDYISVQVDIRFNTFCERIRGSELNRLLIAGQGPSHQAPNPSAPPPPPRSGTFKPNESFLEGRKKTYPWYTVGSTSVPSEERDAIADYIDSGGEFTSVSVPTIYIKMLFDSETLKVFLPLLNDAVNNQKRDPCTKTIVECIVEVVMSRVPRRARLATVLNRIKSSNCMGDLGENMLTFSEGLMHDLHQSSWESTNVVEIGVLMWIADLNMSNPHHLRLSEKVHAAWDLAESNNQPFSIMNCINIVMSHWQKVRKTMLTM